MRLRFFSVVAASNGILSSRAAEAEVEWTGGFVLLFSIEVRNCESHGIPFRSSFRRARRMEERTREEH